MKVREGFVSNSSSSSFVFLFKGATKEDLFSIMRKHEELFVLAFNWDGWSGFKDGNMTVNDVVGCLDSCLSSPKDGEKKYLMATDELLVELNEQLKNLEENNQKHYYDDEIKETSKSVETLKSAVNRGLRMALSVEIGDHHGDISYTPEATTLDYDMKPFNLDDLVLIKKCNH